MNVEFIKYVQQVNIKPGFKAQIIQMYTAGNRLFTELWGKDKDAFIADPAYKQSDFVCEVLPTKKGDYVFICKNRAVFEYVKSNFDAMSAIERGVMYGYPHTAIQAFLELIDRNVDSTKKTTAMNFIGPGFPSEKYFSEEKKHYDSIWKQIKKISPIVAKQCDDAYKVQQTS